MIWMKRSLTALATLTVLLSVTGTVSAQVSRLDDERFERFFDQVRLIDSRHADGLFTDLSSATFENVAYRLELLRGRELKIPLIVGYALGGVEVTLSSGAWFPAGGREARCAPGQTLQDGRCWTITPIAGEEQGCTPICPTGILEGGRCWIVPPSSTRTRGKVRVCSRRQRGRCVAYRWVCPSGTRESGGRCYILLPGPPRYASPSRPVATCLGVEQDGKCWKVGRAPRAGTPRGGADPVYPAVALIFAQK